MLSPVLVFATFIAVSKRDGSEFDISRLFTSLILISLLASPLIQLFQMLPSIGAAIGCLERIQTYLDIEERSDFRHFQPSRETLLDESIDEKDAQISEIVEGQAQDNKQDVVLSMNGASFSWTPTSQPVLKNIDISVHRGEHVAIVGQVGSGKSLLLNAILGEAVQSEGSTTISTPEIGYCSQTPWLENVNGATTVSRHGYNDEAWLKSVIWACALEDVEGLREFSEGNIGTGGAGLSGGQRQRLVGSPLYSRFEKRWV
jgi:ABC-type bacteriocin/lantibiotic exporter with double-glycine peptidase domain